MVQDGRKGVKKSRRGRHKYVWGIPESSSQPTKAPYRTAVKRHDIFGFNVVVQREHAEASLSKDRYPSTKCILPFYSQIGSLAGEREFGAKYFQ